MTLTSQVEWGDMKGLGYSEVNQQGVEGHGSDHGAHMDKVMGTLRLYGLGYLLLRLCLWGISIKTSPIMPVFRYHTGMSSGKHKGIPVQVIELPHLEVSCLSSISLSSGALLESKKRTEQCRTWQCISTMEIFHLIRMDGLLPSCLSSQPLSIQVELGTEGPRSLP
jgi:hypothetical protein